jgi:mono/diheme cytochrome c family protein
MTRKLVYLITLTLILAFALSACGGSVEESNGQEESDPTEVSAGDPVAGETQFQSTCAACHGTDAKGLPNLGKDLTTSEFVASQSDAELLVFVKQGRPVSDPANTTGIDMPPKGGNPALSDEQILDIIAYIRTLQE